MKICGNLGLGIILALFLSLGIIYSLITPIFEASDEISHYPVVQHIATGHGLPVQEPGRLQAWAQEGGQPPLYYVLAALVTFWIDSSDLPQRLWYNPHAQIGIPLAYGNKNMVVHTRAEDFPWQGTVLAVRLIRWLSLILNAGTVLLTYLLAKEISSSSPLKGWHGEVMSLAAAAMVAFNPMFLFISASVNNDNLAVPLSTLTMLLMVRILHYGATVRRFLALGVVLGLAALTKESALGLLPLTALLVTFIAWRGRDPGIFVQGSLLIGLPVMALAGWWYARNWLLYGDPLGWNVWLQIAGARHMPVGPLDLLAEFQGFRISFWGNFGAVNIIGPEWVYKILDIMVSLAALGLLLGLTRRRLPSLLILPALWLTIISVALSRWTMLTYGSQGRLIFPAIGSAGILLAWGLGQLPLRKVALGFSVGFLFLFALVAPFVLIAPTYKPPQSISDEMMVPNRVHIVYEEKAELVGYRLGKRSVWPGDSLPLILYWRARAPMSEDFSVYIHLYDSQRNRVGQWDAYPGNGLHPTRLWRVGEIFVDEYRIPIRADAAGPRMAWVQVGLYRLKTMQNLEARDPTGNVITPILGRFKIAGPKEEIRPEHDLHLTFDDQIELAGFGLGTAGACLETSCTARAGESLPVRLVWRAISVPQEDFTVFVHLLDAEGRLIAQDDSQPQEGMYPTSFWDPGEMVLDRHDLAIPVDTPLGEYTVAIGLYRLADGARLPIKGIGDRVILPIQVWVER